jgi:2,4-dienoyl-CoA reductase-like NADH-dependent reductase (Old Yellow Enzyme family)
VELINLTLGNPSLIPHFNRPCINAPEDGKIGMERIYNVTKEIKAAFPEIAFIMSGLSFEGENALDYAASAIADGITDFAGFGRMTFAYPDFYRDYIKNGKLDKSKVCLKCSKCTELMRTASVAGCPVRDSEAYMPYYRRYVLKK